MIQRTNMIFCSLACIAGVCAPTQPSPVPETHSQAVQCVLESVLASNKQSGPALPSGPKPEPVSAQSSESLRALPSESLAALEGSERQKIVERQLFGLKKLEEQLRKPTEVKKPKEKRPCLYAFTFRCPRFGHRPAPAAAVDCCVQRAAPGGLYQRKQPTAPPGAIGRGKPACSPICTKSQRQPPPPRRCVRFLD